MVWALFPTPSIHNPFSYLISKQAVFCFSSLPPRLGGGNRPLFCRAVLSAHPAYSPHFLSEEINMSLSSTAVPPDGPEPGPKSAFLSSHCGLLANSCENRSSLCAPTQPQSLTGQNPFPSSGPLLPKAGAPAFSVREKQPHIKQERPARASRKKPIKEPSPRGNLTSSLLLKSLTVE